MPSRKRPRDTSVLTAEVYEGEGASGSEKSRTSVQRSRSGKSSSRIRDGRLGEKARMVDDDMIGIGDGRDEDGDAPLLPVAASSASTLSSDPLEALRRMWEVPSTAMLVWIFAEVLDLAPFSLLDFERGLLAPQSSRFLSEVMTKLLLPGRRSQPLRDLLVGEGHPYDWWNFHATERMSDIFARWHLLRVKLARAEAAVSGGEVEESEGEEEWGEVGEEDGLTEEEVMEEESLRGLLLKWFPAPLVRKKGSEEEWVCGEEDGEEEEEGEGEGEGEELGLWKWRGKGRSGWEREEAVEVGVDVGLSVLNPLRGGRGFHELPVQERLGVLGVLVEYRAMDEEDKLFEVLREQDAVDIRVGSLGDAGDGKQVYYFPMFFQDCRLYVEGEGGWQLLCAGKEALDAVFCEWRARGSGKLRKKLAAVVAKEVQEAEEAGEEVVASFRRRKRRGEVAMAAASWAQVEEEGEEYERRRRSRVGRGLRALLSADELRALEAARDEEVREEAKKRKKKEEEHARAVKKARRAWCKRHGVRLEQVRKEEEMEREEETLRKKRREEDLEIARKLEEEERKSGEKLAEDRIAVKRQRRARMRECLQLAKVAAKQAKEWKEKVQEVQKEVIAAMRAEFRKDVEDRDDLVDANRKVWTAIQRYHKDADSSHLRTKPLSSPPPSSSSSSSAATSIASSGAERIRFLEKEMGVVYAKAREAEVRERELLAESDALRLFADRPERDESEVIEEIRSRMEAREMREVMEKRQRELAIRSVLASEGHVRGVMEVEAEDGDGEGLASHGAMVVLGNVPGTMVIRMRVIARLSRDADKAETKAKRQSFDLTLSAFVQGLSIREFRRHIAWQEDPKDDRRCNRYIHAAPAATLMAYYASNTNAHLHHAAVQDFLIADNALAPAPTTFTDGYREEESQRGGWAWETSKYVGEIGGVEGGGGVRTPTHSSAPPRHKTTTTTTSTTTTTTTTTIPPAPTPSLFPPTTASSGAGVYGLGAERAGKKDMSERERAMCFEEDVFVVDDDDDDDEEE